MTEDTHVLTLLTGQMTGILTGTLTSDSHDHYFTTMGINGDESPTSNIESTTL